MLSLPALDSYFPLRYGVGRGCEVLGCVLQERAQSPSSATCPARLCPALLSLHGGALALLAPAEERCCRPLQLGAGRGSAAAGCVRES